MAQMSIAKAHALLMEEDSATMAIAEGLEEQLVVVRRVDHDQRLDADALLHVERQHGILAHRVGGFRLGGRARQPERRSQQRGGKRRSRARRARWFVMSVHDVSSCQPNLREDSTDGHPRMPRHKHKSQQRQLLSK